MDLDIKALQQNLEVFDFVLENRGGESATNIYLGSGTLPWGKTLASLIETLWENWDVYGILTTADVDEVLHAYEGCEILAYKDGEPKYLLTTEWEEVPR